MVVAKKNGGKSKSQQIAEEVARAVGSGRVVAVETVDFSDPNRPKTCLEVDFPILPVNQVAVIEGNAGKPIYQMSKWWARRRSSVFRSTLLAAAMKAPEDPSEAAKSVWDVFYANHQKKGALKHLKVADIFMGGGTTIVEGARLGMQMWGTDLNPVAWFIVKNELSQVKRDEIEALLADIEADVKPQIIPFYASDCPRGHKGAWKKKATGVLAAASFDPLTLTPDERKGYSYEGPETVYVFWAKHGPCQVTGCGHRTPIMSSPVMAVKELTVKAWPHVCKKCGTEYDIEDGDARMAPGVALVVADTEKPFVVLNQRSDDLACPSCGHVEQRPALGSRGEKKKVALSLLVHPEWLRGEPSNAPDGKAYGGSVTDTAEYTARWNNARAKAIRLLEVRGTLPERVKCPDTGVEFSTSDATVTKKSAFACGACGAVEDVLTAVKSSGKSGPVAAYAVQAYCPKCDQQGAPYGGRFFQPVDDPSRFNACLFEWEARNDADLKQYWPRSELPYGFMTHTLNGGIPNHGFTHWWTMFNPRQLLVHAQLLRAVESAGGAKHRWETREYVLGAFQQYLRNQCMFSFWHMTYDKLAPALSNSNFHPKSTVVEVGVFSPMGYGPWSSTVAPLLESIEWSAEPWDRVSVEGLRTAGSPAGGALAGKSTKVHPGDAVASGHVVRSISSTDLVDLRDGDVDLVVTDPPFGGLLHYSELSDFFYVWLRLVLRARYPKEFGAEYTPKTLEVVANRAREPEDPDAYYQRLLTQCWREAHRVLKAGGLLAFTFHHSDDAPWVSVLESLFDAGFCLEATYPIRSDETKGDGQFGSKQVEYDIIHVCRKRTEEPRPTSWAKMRREVLNEVRQLKTILEHHRQVGLPEADLQVIRRGKALEYFSRHYGKVFVDADRPITVKDALVGINQLLDEESGGIKQPPPPNAEPMTRQFLRLFDGCAEMPRDQLQKMLRGTGIAPSDYEERGWCREERKVFHLVPSTDIARAWQGKHRKGMVSDYDQAMFLIGACHDQSGIDATGTLNNDAFRPHPALLAVVEWFVSHGATQAVRNAAGRASGILRSWQAKQKPAAEQIRFLFETEETP